MKSLFATVAIAATVLAVPALAESEIGCRLGNQLNGSVKMTDCRSEGYLTSRAVTPMPWYGGSASFAYVPSPSYDVRMGMGRHMGSQIEGGAVSLEQETELEGGAD